MMKPIKTVTIKTIICVCTFVAVTTGCGVPADSKPRVIPPNQVPFLLLAPSTTQAPTTLPVVTEAATVYMMGKDRLVAVQRRVAAPRSLGTVVSALVQGPTEAESVEGIRSAIDPQTKVLSTQVNGDIAVVNVSDAFSGVGLQDQIVALAQLTYTAAEIPGVRGVQIAINNTPADVPRGDGSATRDPLVRADFAGLAPTS